MLKKGLFLLGTVLLLVGPLGALAPVPTVTPAYVNSDEIPRIDGKLDDNAWRFPTRLTDFQRNDGKGRAGKQTGVFFCYDKQNLYIAFECEESQIEQITANSKVDGQPVWGDDCVEVFISPYTVPDRQNYFHFGVNSLGVKTVETPLGVSESIKWTAAASKGNYYWYVEMAIPLASLEPAGKNEEAWRVNFCRHRAADNENSSWSEVPEKFNSFWRFGKIQLPPGGHQFMNRRGRPHPVTPRQMAVKPEPIKPGTAFLPQGEIPIIPAPREMKYKQGAFTITTRTPIVVGDRITAMDRRAAEEISQETREVLGYSLPIVPVSKAPKGVPAIVVGEPGINALVKKLCAENKRVVTKSSPGPEGYLLQVTPKWILVAGCDQKGTFWGAQTLRQMIKPAAQKQGVVRAAYIRDWPRFSYRGVHLLTAPDGLEFHSRCIERMFSRYKINHIILEAEHVQWDSHPEVYNPARGMSKQDVKKLIEVAKQHHITVTPLIQTLGHMGWMFYNGNHKDLAEDASYPYAFCPKNEKGYRIMFEILDEAIELFGKPRYLHIGHDEFTMRGQFPVHEECMRIGKYQLYYDDTLRYYNYLKSKGVGTMMWGDILLEEGYREKIAELPKDIIICDWHYSPNREYPSLDFFKSAGLKTLGSTWFRPENLYYFSRDASKKNIMGMLQTTWTGFMPSSEVFRKEFHQIHAYILGAEWAWNPDGHTVESLPYSSEYVFGSIWDTSGTDSDKRKFTAIPLTNHCNMTPLDTREKVGWLGIGAGEDISQLPIGTWRFYGGIPFRIQDPRVSGAVGILLKGPSLTEEYPTEVRGIQIGAKVKAVHFLQATGWETAPGEKVCHYTIRYAPSGEVKTDLIYGQNTASWTDTRTLQGAPVAWRGKTASGKPIFFRRFTWENPKPDSVVQSLDFTAANTEAAPILLAVTVETE